MRVSINTVVTMNNGKSYLVLAATNYEGTRYLYLSETNEEKDDLAGFNLIVKEMVQGDKVAFEEVIGDELAIATSKLEELFEGQID